MQKIVNYFSQWFHNNIVSIVSDFKISYLPPLMVYMAAGISGLTAIVGTFYVKERLGLSAEFLAALGFWAGLPWALKMPIGHLVDLIWRWKSILVFLGASLIAISLLIMISLLSDPSLLSSYSSIENWFVFSALLAPIGYVLQDVVADAMTVESIPNVNKNGIPYDKEEIKLMHTTMQTLGRVAIVSGGIFVSLLNVFLMDGVDALPLEEKSKAYLDIYQIALVIPLVSVLGVLFSFLINNQKLNSLTKQGMDKNEALKKLNLISNEKTNVNWLILIGGLLFSVLSIFIGLMNFKFGQELIFLLSMIIIFILINQISNELTKESKKILIGTAIIIFVYRAMPGPGPGSTWWMIDVLKFDQQFIAKLSLIASVLALFGMFIFRKFMAEKSISYVIGFLTIVGFILTLPITAMFFGFHEWTAKITNGVIDARAIALIDTALESPLGQIAMIPMLAWIANSAPRHLKATFFAVMASFTNLALSAASLGTKYYNQIYTVSREVKDSLGNVITPQDYSELGMLMITASVVMLVMPILAIYFVKKTKFVSA